MKPQKVLFVEDDKPTLKITKKWVGKEADNLADFAKSLREAKALIAKNDYRLFILDFSLGDGNAEDVVDYANSLGKKVPYVVFTAYDESTIIRWVKDKDFVDECVSFVRKDKVTEFRNAVVSYISGKTDESVFKNIDEQLEYIRVLAKQCSQIIEDNT